MAILLLPLQIFGLLVWGLLLSVGVSVSLLEWLGLVLVAPVFALAVLILVAVRQSQEWASGFASEQERERV